MTPMVKILHDFMTKDTTLALPLHIFHKEYYTTRPRLEFNLHNSYTTP